jgi:hypothetical protein
MNQPLAGDWARVRLSRTATNRDADRAKVSRLGSREIEPAAKMSARHFIAPLIVLAVTSIVYGAIYFRDESVPTALGANLVPAERVLNGEVPYRDFYKIQTPGILLLNAGLFKVWGTSWISAASGVLVFKILTITLMFVIARRISSWKVAVVSAGLALVWLAPGGPFRPAPIQYEMLFIMAAIYCALRWLESRRRAFLFVAGFSVGMVAVFKQNVGVYAAIALLLSIVVNAGVSQCEETRKPRAITFSVIAAMAGVAIPLLGLLLYLISNRALEAALDVFIRGPGEHLQSRFTGYALPKHAVIILVAGALGVTLAGKLAQRLPRLQAAIGFLTLLAAAVCGALVPPAAIDNSIYWFSPALFGYAGWSYFRERKDQSPVTRYERGVLLVLLLFALAAYGEVFPRAVRGLVIGTLPAAFLLLGFLLEKAPGRADKDGPGPQTRRLAFAGTAIVLFVFAARIEVPKYFSIDRALRFRADTELSFDRGRGIYLPSDRAQQVDALVAAIQLQVEQGGYFFAHALDATSYYFLAGRKSPTGATLWNDTGTSDRERVRTLQSLRDKNVRLVLTSEQAMSAEPYQPLRDYLDNDFQTKQVIGKTILLERKY